VQPGDVVELHPKDGFKHGDFLLIRDIMENVLSREIKLRGLWIRRTKYVGGALDRKLNEVFIKIEVDEDDDRDPFVQGAIEVLRHEMFRKRNLVSSSNDFPADSYREIWSPELAANERDTIRESARLTCRWVLIHTFESAAERTRSNPKPKAKEGYLRRIEPVECVDGAFIPGGPRPQPYQRTSTQGRNWRGQAVKSARYTYGTGCCGAGGDAEGARMAGVRVMYGWDHDDQACKSFKLNHPQAQVYECEAVSFPTDPDLTLHVDIMHLSLPCCYFSPAHTHEGKDDDAHIATFLAAKRILTDTKPIIHTQENTFGLFSHHPEYFATLIWMITSAGYNVRWKVVQFKEYGLPASRRRLIVIASL
jgi:DNA (cytosine-5)-methyltransferase 1